MSAGVGDQIVGPAGELGLLTLAEVLGGVRHGIDVPGGHDAVGQRVLEAGHRGAHPLPLGRRSRLLRRLTTVVRQRMAWVGRSTLGRESPLSSGGSHLPDIARRPQLGDPTQVGVELARVERVGVGVTHLGVRRIRRTVHLGLRSVVGKIGEVGEAELVELVFDKLAGISRGNPIATRDRGGQGSRSVQRSTTPPVGRDG